MNRMTKARIAPVEKTLTVDRNAETAFRFFTGQLDVWWPKETHSLGADRDGITPTRVDMEAGVGGRLFETAADGTERFWGEIKVWEPGKRLVFSWGFDKPEEIHTEVEVVFTAISKKQTRIDLTHRGWEKDPDGASLREGYNHGWDPVVANLLERCHAHA